MFDVCYFRVGVNFVCGYDHDEDIREYNNDYDNRNRLAHSGFQRAFTG